MAETASGSGRPARGAEAEKTLIVVDDVRFDAHAPRAYHPERPERLVAARQSLANAAAATGVTLVPAAARAATDDELARVHTPAFVAQLAALAGHEGYINPDTYYGPKSVEAARLAAGGAIAMVDALLDGPSRRGVALLRPPGHHARPAQAMGFCLLNSVAVAAAHARARGLSRVLVLDWDVHHGNGTQEIFYGDPSVLYVSTHQFPFYPGTGALNETGSGDGKGYTLNVPFSAGGGDEVYRGAFERVILPVCEAYAPELVLVSAGFDASVRDPLANMRVSSEGFRWMASALAAQAEKSAGGKIALVLEGGYDLVGLEAGLGEAIGGIVAGGLPEIAREPGHQDVARAARVAKRAWPVVA